MNQPSPPKGRHNVRVDRALWAAAQAAAADAGYRNLDIYVTDALGYLVRNRHAPWDATPRCGVDA